NIKRFVFDEKVISGKELSEILLQNFKDNEQLRQRLIQSPKFGNGDTETDKIAEELSAFIYNEIGLYAPYRGGRFLPSCIMFVTYEGFGKPVGATPDGRLAGTPVADSCGAMQGRDIKGPTALLASALNLDQRHAAGTLVLNMRISKLVFDDPEGRLKLQKIISAYLSAGGQQVQINVLDGQTLRKALENPEEYPNLIVRMGGYSEFFGRLSRELKLSVIERTEHTL
ncbi:MAG: pyruvate formate-lyase, partial [Clostridia bacterium]|nr:pyruvate formate-lyase [Clostridia bacterium]